MKAIRLSRVGGPEVLEWVDVDAPQPTAGQVVVRNAVVGLNFIDVYQRTGLYPMALPAIPGNEAAGVIESVGEGVTSVQPGDRVAFVMTTGAYAEASCVPEARIVKLPDSISFETAAAGMLKGLTAGYLVREIWPVQAGETVLVHAAAGGVGSILSQWLSHIGVEVIGTAGTPEKAEKAKSNGCKSVILYDHEDVAEQVLALTQGQGVRVIYDAVGKAAFQANLKCLGRRGLLVNYGNASGAIPPMEPLVLSQNGSLYLTRPTLTDYIPTQAALWAAAAALFHVIDTVAVTVEIGQNFPLADAGEAHKALEARQTTGATILTL